jgi:hypothetical protein
MIKRTYARGEKSIRVSEPKVGAERRQTGLGV